MGIQKEGNSGISSIVTTHSFQDIEGIVQELSHGIDILWLKLWNRPLLKIDTQFHLTNICFCQEMKFNILKREKITFL